MTDTCTIKTTALREACEKAGGKMVDFHGWLLPVQYDGILAEHKAVRESAGMFDVSHMGQLFVEGKQAWEFLQFISCNNIKNGPAEGTYFHILTDEGTIIDDAIAFCLSPEQFLVVVNAACHRQSCFQIRIPCPLLTVGIRFSPGRIDPNHQIVSCVYILR